MSMDKLSEYEKKTETAIPVFFQHVFDRNSNKLVFVDFGFTHKELYEVVEQLAGIPKEAIRFLVNSEAVSRDDTKIDYSVWKSAGLIRVLGDRDYFDRIPQEIHKPAKDMDIDEPSASPKF